jgi:DNA-binding HxlR family transcriptional regulator
MEKMTETPDCSHVTSLSGPPPEIDATLSVLGGKWKMLILWQLLGRPSRFNELRRAITGVSQHMLTVQLRELESQGVITRTVFAEVPPRVEYALSEHGKSLGGVVRALAEWGKSHLARQPS